MSIRGKVLFIGFIVLSLLSVGLGLGVIYQIKKNFQAQLVEYRQQELQKIKDRLKDLVDIVYTALDRDYRSLEDMEFLAERYGQRLRNLIDFGESVVRYHLVQAEQGTISQAQAQAQALAMLQKIRYDAGDTGYIWVNDTTTPYPIMLMHPTIPELNGKVMDDPQYSKIALHQTTDLFPAILALSTEQGGGFIDYVWPKFTAEGMIPNVRKLSYVRLLPEWGWILGTGVYIDDAKRQLLDKIKADLRKIRYDNGEGYFWIQDTKQPYPNMVMHALFPSLEGQALQGDMYKQPDQRELGKMTLEAVQENGAGYIEYVWPKAGADNMELQPKLAYLHLYEPLGWIIGSGIYIDRIDATIAHKKAQLKAQIKTMLWNLFWLSGILFSVMAIILLLLLQRLLAPLSAVGGQLQVLAQGKLSKETISYRSKDEIGVMIQAFTKVRDKISITIHQAQAIAGGDYRQTLHPAPDDQLDCALAEMTDALRQAAEQSARQNWLKTGQNHLHEALRDEHTLASLAHNAAQFLQKYLAVSPVLFYVWHDEDNCFHLYASYGFERRNTLANRIHLGEGLIGQAALEKTLITIAQQKTDDSVINAPYILAVPFFHEHRVTGGIEIGGQQAFSDLQTEFLELIMPDVAISVRSVQMYTVIRNKLNNTHST